MDKPYVSLENLKTFWSTAKQYIDNSSLSDGISDLMDQVLADAKTYTDDREAAIDAKWAAADDALELTLQSYVDEAQVQEMVKGKLDKTEAASTYISKTDASSMFASKNDLSSKQDTITDLNDIRGGVQKASEAIDMVNNLTTEVSNNEEVTSKAISDLYLKLENAGGGSPDMSNYVTKDELNDVIGDISTLLDAINGEAN